MYVNTTQKLLKQVQRDHVNSKAQEKEKSRSWVPDLQEPLATQFTCVPPPQKKAIFVFLSIVAVFNNMVLFALSVEYVSKYV